jgi:hypothetical protein
MNRSRESPPPTNIDLYGLSDLEDTPATNVTYNSTPYLINK